MIRKIIIKELQNKGYNVREVKNIRNGIELYGIAIISDGSNISPVIYIDEIIKKAQEEGKSLEEVIMTIISIYKEYRDIDFDVNRLFDKKYILSHIYIGLQRQSIEPIVKRNCSFDKIESYLYVRDTNEMSETYSIKISRSYLNMAEVTEKEAWDRAEQNTYGETVIQSMSMFLAELTGMEYDRELEKEIPLYIVTNGAKFKGASALLNKKILTEFAQAHGVNKIVVMPSSIHEAIIMPYTDDTNLAFLSRMVQEINATEVLPEEQLSDQAYIIEA